jgi:hypothetical protein
MSSDRHIPRRTLTSLTSYRTSLLSAIGHLRGIEEAESRRPRPPTTRRTAGVPDLQVCEGCHATGHHYTECLNHSYVWDSATSARLLEPGERLSGPANWQDIHRASLHHLIRTAIQYYILVHHTHIQDIHTLLTDLEANSQFGDISRYAFFGVSGSADSPEAEREYENRPSGSPSLPTNFPPPSHGTPGIFLINLAVLATATRLRIDPWRHTTGYVQFLALHHWHPSFGVAFPTFLQLVHTELRDGLLQQADLDANPLDIQVGPPSDLPSNPFAD